VINRAAARRINRNNQKAKKLAATSTEATPERSLETGKRVHSAGDAGLVVPDYPAKKARLDSTLHLQKATALADSTPVDTDMGPEDRNELVETVALMDADSSDSGAVGEVASAVLAAEEAGLQAALDEVTRDADATME
jgi:hypothetical protein